MTIEVLPFAEQARAAMVELLTGTATDAGIKLQVYRGRPRSINPPTAFIDVFRETFTDYTGIYWAARKIGMEVICLWGLYDSGEAVDQRDRFVDKFYEYVLPRFHAAGGNALVEVQEILDDPTYVPDWLAPDEQRTYFSTRFTVEASTRG